MWFIQTELLNKYCEMLDYNFLVTDFDILFKLLNCVTLHYIHIHFTDSMCAPRELKLKQITNRNKVTYRIYKMAH